jgi:hypothetical protein
MNTNILNYELFSWRIIIIIIIHAMHISVVEAM